MMHQGNWTCASCGKEITELPFEPRDTSNLNCRDCHQKNRGDRPERRERPQRQMYKGEWTCSECGNTITELPFEPRHTDGLKCRDCLHK